MVKQPFNPTADRVLSLALLFFYFIFWISIIPYGSVSRTDEILTKNRSEHFVISGKWFCVETNGVPDFNKPPLHYWLTAGLLGTGVAESFALRFWAVVFSIATLWITGELSHFLSGGSPWVRSISILLLLSSQLFNQMSVLAMLDTGHSFFLVLAIFAFLKALKSPKWWIFCGVAIGFGAIQKTPTAMVAVLLMCVVSPFLEKQWKGDWRKRFQCKFFWIGGFLAVLPITFWTIIQLLQYGTQYFRQAYVHELAGRVAPMVPDQWFRVFTWMAVDGWWIWAAAFIAVLWVVLNRTESSLKPHFYLIVLSMFYLLVMSLARGHVAPRYNLTVLPFVVAITASVIPLMLIKYRMSVFIGIIPVLLAVNIFLFQSFKVNLLFG